MKNYFLYLSFAFIIFSSCEKTVTIDIPQKTSVLVVNAILEQNKGIEVMVGKSKGILDPGYNINDDLVKNAIPIVLENDIPIDTLVYQASSFRYKSPRNKTIRTGYIYTIKVTAPGFSPVEASTVVPSQSEIAEVSRTKDARISASGDHMDEIIIKLNDPAEKNFYLIQFLRPPFDPRDEATPIYCVNTTDKDLELIGDNADPLSTDNCYDGNRLIMRDDNFNGRLKQLRFFISSDNLMESTNITGQPNKPFVKVSRITEEHFKFIKSSSVYDNAKDNPFAEPVNVFSNVKSGYGIFAAYTSAVHDL